jgi:hypothetical protein
MRARQLAYAQIQAGNKVVTEVFPDTLIRMKLNKNRLLNLLSLNLPVQKYIYGIQVFYTIDL